MKEETEVKTEKPVHKRQGHRGFIRKQWTTGKDWCHICGRRSKENVEIDYSRNAEHYDTYENYVRLCKNCVQRLNEVFSEEGGR